MPFLAIARLLFVAHLSCQHDSQQISLQSVSEFGQDTPAFENFVDGGGSWIHNRVFR